MTTVSSDIQCEMLNSPTRKFLLYFLELWEIFIMFCVFCEVFRPTLLFHAKTLNILFCIFHNFKGYPERLIDNCSTFNSLLLYLHWILMLCCFAFYAWVHIVYK